MKRPRDDGKVDILARLKDVRRSGKGWTAKCPAHKDRQNSLSVQHRDGKWLLKCHAGSAKCASHPPNNRATAQPAGLTLEQYAAAKALPVSFLQECGLSNAAL